MVSYSFLSNKTVIKSYKTTQKLTKFLYNNSYKILQKCSKSYKKMTYTF
jgi:hypothetical protein